MIGSILRVSTKPGTVATAVKIFNGIIETPTMGWEVVPDCINTAAVETVGTVVDYWIGGEWKICGTFVGLVGTALTGIAHHAVGFGAAD